MYYGVTTIMIKYPIPLIILLIIPFFINPASAGFVNGDFATGDLTGWTVDITNSSGSSGTGGYVGVYFSPNAYWGHVEWQPNGEWCKVRTYQSVDLTGWGNISVYGHSMATGATGEWHGTIFVDDDHTQIDYGPWIITKKDVSSYSGFHTVGFESYALGPDSHANVYCREIKLIDYYLCDINYNPDIPVSDTKPFNLSYILNSTYADNPLYPCFIYSYTGIDISPNDTPNIIWIANYEGYVNQASGDFTTSDYFHHYDWWDLNISYGVVLFNPDDRTPGYINFDTIEDDPNFLSKDQIYVHYNYSYPTPTPQPTPNMTAIPTPSGTPTSQPTATPQPNPESINESLNTSFKQGYSNLVNTTIDGFYEPVYNFTYYIASPLLGINDTLYNFSIHMNESFTNSNNSLILSSSILFMIMVNIPDKLINVMTYYLIWLIILLIFKGDA